MSSSDNVGYFLCLFFIYLNTVGGTHLLAQLPNIVKHRLHVCLIIAPEVLVDPAPVGARIGGNVVVVHSLQMEPIHCGARNISDKNFSTFPSGPSIKMWRPDDTRNK